jgi:hypothetical protein
MGSPRCNFTLTRRVVVLPARTRCVSRRIISWRMSASGAVANVVFPPCPTHFLMTRNTASLSHSRRTSSLRAAVCSANTTPPNSGRRAREHGAEQARGGGGRPRELPALPACFCREHLCAASRAWAAVSRACAGRRKRPCFFRDHDEGDCQNYLRRRAHAHGPQPRHLRRVRGHQRPRRARRAPSAAERSQNLRARAAPRGGPEQPSVVANICGKIVHNSALHIYNAGVRPYVVRQRNNFGVFDCVFTRACNRLQLPHGQQQDLHHVPSRHRARGDQREHRARVRRGRCARGAGQQRRVYLTPRAPFLEV